MLWKTSTKKPSELRVINMLLKKRIKDYFEPFTPSKHTHSLCGGSVF